MNTKKKDSFLISYSDKSKGEIFRSTILEHFPQARVIDSPDAREVLRRVTFEKFSVLVLDLEPSNGDGVHLLNEVLALRLSVQPEKYLILSDSRDTCSHFLNNERVVVVVKPLPMIDFVEAVYQVLGFQVPVSNEGFLMKSIMSLLAHASVHILSTRFGVASGEVLEGERNSLLYEKKGVAASPIRGDGIQGYLKFVLRKSPLSQSGHPSESRKKGEGLDNSGRALSELCSATFGLVQKFLGDQGYQIEPYIPFLSTEGEIPSMFDLAHEVSKKSIKTAFGFFEIDLALRIRK